VDTTKRQISDFTTVASYNNYAPAPRVGGIKRRCTSDVCLSVAYIGPNSRTERPEKTNIGTDVAHVTWLRHHFQGQNVKGKLAGGGGILWQPPAQLVWPCIQTVQVYL